jgi:hypothetical protein
MAKKQTRRSISVSRGTYERLKAFCETQGISMSQFVESRVGDFLGRSDLSELGARPDLGARSEASSRADLGRADLGRADLGRADLGRVEPIAKPAPAPVKVTAKEERPKDPDIKLTADQIFTF